MGVRCRLSSGAFSRLLPAAVTAGLTLVARGLRGWGEDARAGSHGAGGVQVLLPGGVAALPGVLTPPGMAAMAYVESRFNPDAESGNGAEGLMQILPSVFAQYGVDANGDGKRDIFNAADSVATSAVYTCVLAADVRSIHGDQVALRLAAYNAGIGAVHRYHGVPPYPETKDYIAQVKLWTARFAPQFAPSPTPSS